MTARDPDPKIMHALQFVKVSVTQGMEPVRAGYLTYASCIMLLVELERRGFVVSPTREPSE